MFGTVFEVAFREFAQMGGFMVTKGNVVIAAVCRGNTVEFATAVCAPHDTFIEAVGMAIALQHFFDGQTVMLPCSEAFFL